MLAGGFSSIAGAAPAGRVPLVAQCGACGLYKGCGSPKMPVDGEGRKKILVVGEAPGYNEDREGRPFVGKTGQLLERELARVGIDLRRDCWVTNSVICFPRTPKGEGRNPKPQEVGYCRPNLIAAVRKLGPEVILLFGKPALLSLLGYVWKEDLGPVGKWVGWRIPDRRLNAWICPLWHPSYVSRSLDERDGELILHIYRKHLKAAAELSGRPHPPNLPKLEREVEVLLDSRRAAERLRDLVRRGGEVAFDYETTTVKPDGPASKIYCCSVSREGEETFAFPWHGPAVAAMGELLRSDLPKYGHNIKFEDRWTRKEFGFGVRNWVWDGMMAAHVLDGRSGVTGLKFQAFVRLGVGPYNEGVEPFLKGKGSCYTPNKIHEADLTSVLRYCAIDSLLEYRLGKLQQKDLGYE